jgi:hypothetical protein
MSMFATNITSKQYYAAFPGLGGNGGPVAIGLAAQAK